MKAMNVFRFSFKSEAICMLIFPLASLLVGSLLVVISRLAR